MEARSRAWRRSATTASATPASSTAASPPYSSTTRLGWANALSITKGGDPSQHDTVKQFGMTANLSVNYRRPLFVGQTVVISCSLDRVEGRKRFLKGVMKDGKTGGVIADATALYRRAAHGGGVLTLRA